MKPIRNLLLTLACLCWVACAGAQKDNRVYGVEESERVATELFAEGDGLYLEGKLVPAHEKYEEGLSVSPLSPRAGEVVARQYEIGRKLLFAPPTGLFGLPFPKIVSSEGAGLNVLRDVVARGEVASEAAASGSVGPKSYPAMENAQWTLATHFFANKEYKEALEQFKSLVDHFPNGQWTIKAAWYTAESYYRQSDGAEYDETVLDQALARFEHFQKSYPFPIARQEDIDLAKERIVQIKNRKAKKRYLTALLYVERKEYKAAQRYCHTVVSAFGSTDWAQPAATLLTQVDVALAQIEEIE